MAPQLKLETESMPATAQQLDDARQFGELVACVKQLTTIAGDHEVRLRRMERYTFIAFGAFMLFHFVTEWVDKLHMVEKAFNH